MQNTITDMINSNGPRRYDLQFDWRILTENDNC